MKLTNKYQTIEVVYKVKDDEPLNWLYVCEDLEPVEPSESWFMIWLVERIKYELEDKTVANKDIKVLTIRVVESTVYAN